MDGSKTSQIFGPLAAAPPAPRTNGGAAGWWIAIVLIGGLCSQACGQIKLTQEVTQTWVGFENPTIVNGAVVSGSNSRPTLASTAMTIKVETAVAYKFSQVSARRIPTLEKITLEVIDGGYRFKPSAPAGTYSIEYLAFDPDRGIASEEITVELKPLAPVDPIIPDLGGLPADARKAVVALVQGMGADMANLGDGVKTGRLKTAEDVKAASVPQDTVTRNAFKEAMRSLMEPRLGNDPGKLVPQAEQVFRDIATGFRSVK